MKTQDVRGKSGFYSTCTATLRSNESCTEPPDCHTWPAALKRNNYFKQGVLIFVPLLLFVALGLYFLSIDVNNPAVKWETNTSCVTWSDFYETPELISVNSTEPTTTVITTEEITEEPKESLILFQNDNRTEFVLGKSDFDDLTDFLKIFKNRTEKDPLTTPRGFHYSATVPKSGKPTDPTLYFNSTEPDCFSTRIPFCEGVLPYDMVQLPTFASIRSRQELDAMLPYFQLIVQSGCSARARDFICSILEPECRPNGLRPPAPCKLHCKVLAKECKEFIMETLPLSQIFDCRRYPDWDENQECLNLSKGNCFSKEMQCPDGTCIPSDWVCDGVHDCPGTRPSLDESDCGSGCSAQEFRCVSDRKCVPENWHCDGQLDCLDGSDETSC